MTPATTTPDCHLPVIALTVAEQAVAADERRIAIELVDTVIRDLFGVGLTLQGAMPLLGGPAQQRVDMAIDGIDRIIRTIRDVVFDLTASDDDRRTTKRRPATPTANHDQVPAGSSAVTGPTKERVGRKSYARNRLPRARPESMGGSA